MNATTTRVFIVDGHELVRRGLVDLVAAEPDLDVVGSAGSAEAALPLIAASSPDVVLLDARLTEGAGLGVGRRIRSDHPDVPCVLLASFDDDEALFTAVMAGAAGYLVKQVGGSSLLDGVRTVAGGRPLLDGAVVERLLDRLRRSGQGDHRGGSLDDHEQQVLELVSRGSTDRQIAEKLDTSPAEVQVWVTSLHAKLALRSRGPSVPPGHRMSPADPA
ncbi:two-component system, NarL family, response regulator DevR [Friedmanniella luteola]|uniref:Two-component system, NarL family, response regulator DevR n=1 Tax=Friedmanniella luteola TaxID=546871 RepID=A0A1H2A2B3_9ACTN|nr:response regulator transcription factor [Friedmanniella luteola]SDT39999.1 two-component system, NarL family, response regulator DevR [Friedmanniella luteola]